MPKPSAIKPPMPSRPARGGWIEISYRKDDDQKQERPAPHGAGGLKSYQKQAGLKDQPSRPARGGWIEILLMSRILSGMLSRPARGGWIEIHSIEADSKALYVPPRTGRVD